MPVTADLMVKLYYSLRNSHLTYVLHEEDRDTQMPLRLSVLTGEQANYSQNYNHRILTCHFIYDYFALLKAFNTNTLNFHQYFNDKLSSHQPSHLHNTRQNE